MHRVTVFTAALLLALPVMAQDGSRGGDPGRPPAYSKLVAEFAAASAKSQVAMKELLETDEFKKAAEAKDTETMKALRAKVTQPNQEFAQRALAEAEKVQGDDRVSFLVWAAVNGRSGEIANHAVAALQQDHLKSKHLTELFENFAMLANTVDDDQAAAFLAKVQATTPHAQVHAWADYLEARRLNRRGASDADKARAERLLAEGETLAAGTDLVDLIAAPRFEKEKLQIGMPAPDIAGEDIDGVRFKLSDYRGKVLVVDFWGFW